MTRLPLRLRLFWAAYVVLVLAALLAPSVGPWVEAHVAPIRVEQSIKDVHRGRAFLRFTWVSTKLRSPGFADLDVALITPRDRFVPALYTDLSEPGSSPCSDTEPWGSPHAKKPGEWDQPFCVEVPRRVGGGEPIDLPVTIHYRGLWGLWTVPVRLPPIHSDSVDE